MATTEEPSASPPEGDGPSPGSEAWQNNQDLQAKKKDHGAGVGHLSDHKIRQFTLAMDIYDTDIDENTPLLNLYNAHKGFVAQLFTIAKGDTHFLATAKQDNPDNNTPSPILSADGFPSSDRHHRSFFRRQFYRSSPRKTTITIYHSILTKEDLSTIKDSLFNYLKEHKLWMRGGDFNETDTHSIGWLLGAHHAMVYRPRILTDLNFLIRSIPRSQFEKAVEDYGEPQDLNNPPEIFVHSKLQSFGVDKSRVSTFAVSISCVKTKVRLMKELICLIPDQKMVYPFIPIGLANILSVDDYKKYIVLNNDRQNAIQGVTVQGFSQELLRKDIPDGIASSRVDEYFLDQPFIVSIQETNSSTTQGRYIFIVQKTDYNQARTFIEDFCQNIFPRLYPTQSERSEYKKAFGYTPKLTSSASAGGAVASLGSRLGELLKAEETKLGKSLSLTPVTWAQRASPRFLFDKDADFPALSSKLKPQTSAPTNATSSTNTPGPSDSTNNSVISINSTSTTPANNHSGQTVVSTDISVAISEMKSVMSQQTDFIKQMMERQEKQDEINRQAAKEAQEAAREMAKEAREAAKQASLENQKLLAAAAEDNRKIMEAAYSSSRENHKLMEKMLELMMSMKQSPPLPQHQDLSQPSYWPISGHNYMHIPPYYANPPLGIPTPETQPLLATGPSAPSTPNRPGTQPPPSSAHPPQTPLTLEPPPHNPIDPSTQSDRSLSETSMSVIDEPPPKPNHDRTPGSTPTKTTKQARTTPPSPPTEMSDDDSQSTNQDKKDPIAKSLFGHNKTTKTGKSKTKEPYKSGKTYIKQNATAKTVGKPS